MQKVFYILIKGQSYAVFGPSGRRYLFYKNDEKQSVPVEITDKNDIIRMDELTEYVKRINSDKNKVFTPLTVVKMQTKNQPIISEKVNNTIEKIDSVIVNNPNGKSQVKLNPELVPLVNKPQYTKVNEKNVKEIVKEDVKETIKDIKQKEENEIKDFNNKTDKLKSNIDKNKINELYELK